MKLSKQRLKNAVKEVWSKGRRKRRRQELEGTTVTGGGHHRAMLKIYPTI